MEPAHHESEEERLRDLRSFEILDTPPEAYFDQITTLAALVCDTPVALLSFFDNERQWIKSSFGMNIKEIPRRLSACNKTIENEGIHIIPDTQASSCPENEYLLKLGFRFYAGIPIITKTGNRIGSLCVLDRLPRHITEEQATTLKTLSDQVLENLEIRKKYKENLELLNEYDRLLMGNDQRILDVAYKRSHRAIAEIATGLNFRMRPFILNILSNSRLLLKDQNLINGTKAKIRSIEESSSRVMAILDELDKFIMAEKEKWMKLLEINSLLNEVIANLQHKFVKNNIEVEIHLELELRCIGNYTKLYASFFSIVSNAIEAIPPSGGKIEISLKQEGRKAIIYIKDNGEGIPASIRPYIFQPFFTTKNSPGLGIGLALAKAHIEEHFGTIEIESLGNPTVFKVTIPTPS